MRHNFTLRIIFIYFSATDIEVMEPLTCTAATTSTKNHPIGRNEFSCSFCNEVKYVFMSRRVLFLLELAQLNAVCVSETGGTLNK